MVRTALATSSLVALGWPDAAISMLPRVSAPRNSRASVSGSSTRSRPASRAARPPAGALTFGPALDWVEAALPQQNGAVLAELAGPVAVIVTGPGHGRSSSARPGNP